MAELLETCLPDTMKDGIEFRLVLALDPWWGQDGGKVSGKKIGPHTVAGVVWGGINEDRGECEGVWWSSCASGYVNENEAL